MKANKAASLIEQLYVLEQVGLFGGRCEEYVAKIDNGEVTATSGVTYTSNPTEAMIGDEGAIAGHAELLRDNGHPVILTPLSKVPV